MRVFHIVNLLVMLASMQPLLAQGGTLEVVEAALRQYDGGPPVAANYEFFPGDTVFFTFRVAGFKVKEKGDDEVLNLSYQIEALDSDGVKLKEPVSDKLLGEITAEDKKSKWTPMAQYDVLVPPSAASGSYKIIIKVQDHISAATAEKEVLIRVKARNVEPSESLVARNFRFLRSETDTRALSPAAYKPGDTVWARFDITGYKFAEGNKFSIDYGLTVLRESGKELYRQEIAAQENRQSYYPQRHIPGSLSLSLTQDLSKGPYTIVLTIRDHIGQQNYESKHVFQVE